MYDKNKGIRAITSIIVLALILSVSINLNIKPVYAASSVKIGQASRGESGSINQQAGDQTGKEVKIIDWEYGTYSTRTWTVVARPNSPDVAKKIAQVVYDACKNDHVGYDRSEENGDIKSFYYALKASGWDASKIAIDCETTCTPLIAAAIHAALDDEFAKDGIELGLIPSAGTLQKFFKKSSVKKYFTRYTSKDYVASDANLMAGDILIAGSSHGAVVVSSPNSTDTSAEKHTPFKESGKSDYGYKIGKLYSLEEDSYVWFGPNSNYYNKRLRTQLTKDGQKNALSETYACLKSGTEVTCLGLNGSWTLIPSGWINGKLKEVVKEEPNPTDEASASPKKEKKPVITVKIGKNYKLTAARYVRKGAGTKYSIKKRSQLSKDAKKHAYKTTKARLKKGTVVTCQKISGNWMKIPSGWICYRSSTKAYVK